MGIKCFFLEPVEDLHEYDLRRYTGNHEGEYTCQGGWHDASIVIGRHPVSFAPRINEGRPVSGDLWPHDDVLWPNTCSKCSYQFRPEDNFQFNAHPLYRKYGTEEILTLRSASVGAMWFADWMGSYMKEGSCDGHVLGVRLPGNHDWMPEQRANNCDSPCKTCNVVYHQHYDKTRWDAQNNKSIVESAASPQSCNKQDEVAGKAWADRRHYIDGRPHKCWVRHGTPPHQVVHVDKSGVTCGAGAGSIAIPGWHGFLHNGELVG